jgi:hypothetical protein
MFNIAWLPDGRIYFGRAATPVGDAETWRVRAAGGPAEQLRLPELAGCLRTEYLRVEPLPDGELGLTRFCSKDPPQRTDTGAVEPRSMRFRQLAPLGETNPSAVTWRTGLRQGFMSHTIGDCAGIAALTRQGMQRLPGPVTLDGKTWRLDQDAIGPLTDCTDRGRVDLPVLSPDGRILYFIASPESLGVSGEVSREETGWGLFRVAVDGIRLLGDPRRITDDLGKPQGLAISPDGHSLVFAGQHDGQYGLWLIDARTGDELRLAAGKFMDGAFSPDNLQVAAIFQREADHCQPLVLELPNRH